MFDRTISTKLWSRGESSLATTVPKDILISRGVRPPAEDSGKRIVADWNIDEETRQVTVSFREVDEGE